MTLYPVILAGGASSRLWPVSDLERPKWDLQLFGSQTLLQAAWARARAVAPASHCLVVAGSVHERCIRQRLPQLPRPNLLIEPEPRDTAGAIALAAGRVLAQDAGAVLLVLPGDHVIDPVERFARCAQAAAARAERDQALVLFGIVPRAPATAYGYVQRGATLAPLTPDPHEPPSFKVRAFKEKPERSTAEAYVQSGEYYWNGGLFAFPLGVLRDELRTQLPGHAAMVEALAQAGRAWTACARKHFPGLRKVSIDYGIMEHARAIAGIAADFSWDDIGSWSAVGPHLDQCAGNSVSSGATLQALDARGNVVVAPDRHVALIGVEGLAVVVDGNRVLVCRLDRDQQVRDVAQAAVAGAAKPASRRKSKGKKAQRGGRR